jgi:single-strand DNA-binding protein
MINKVILVGNVGKDPEIRAVGESNVANFTLATSESWKDKTNGERKTQTEWHNITAWRNLADLSSNYIKKGSKIYVEGKLTTRSYEKQDGNTAYITEIIASNITLLDSKSQTNQAPPAQAQVHAQQASAVSNDEKDDLPF